MEILFTEQEYDQLLDEVDPDDIKDLLDLTNDQDVLNELYDLHKDAKRVLDYMGRVEYGNEAIEQLALFFVDVQDFLWGYEDRLETNSQMISKLRAFLDKAPESLWELSDEALQKEINR